MDLKYETEYNQIKQKYQGKMNLEEKRIAYELLNIEIETLESNITTYDKDGIVKLATFTLSATALLLSIGGFVNNIIKSDQMLINIYNILIMCLIIVLLILEFSKVGKVDKIRKENEQKIKVEKEEIKKLKLEKLVVKNLAIEEDNIYSL